MLTCTNQSIWRIAMDETHEEVFSQVEEATIFQLQEAMSSGRLTAERLVELYLERIEDIDRHGPTLKSIIEINPECLEIARQLDRERADSGVRGPLHGIPVLIKDNIATDD